MRSTFAPWLALAFALPAFGRDCADTDTSCLRDGLRQHVVRDLDYWRPMLQRPLSDRIRPAPAEVVDYLALDNRLNGFPERPRSATPDAAFLADLRRAADGIPARVWDLVAPGLAGVLLVDRLGSTGFTSIVRDAQGRAVAASIVLDAGLLAGLDGNGWASWKENTPFRRDGLHRLSVQMEPEASNEREAAIRYILLHELGHVAGILKGVHPGWEAGTLPTSLAPWPFLQVSWAADRKGHPHPRDGQGFAQRADVVYYVGAKLDIAEAAPTYRALARTSFPTLYAATNPWDDFAESFANYVHVVLLRKPWRVQVRGVGDDTETFDACWGLPRCEAKERMLRALLGP